MKIPLEIKLTINEGLRRIAGDASDNLYRAKAAFKHCTPEQLGQRYGQSDDTRAEIIAGYQESLDDANQAIEWVNANG